MDGGAWWAAVYGVAKSRTRLSDFTLSFYQGIFLTQGLNPGLLHWRQTLLLGAAAAAAKSLQSCPTLCNPIDGSPPGSPVPGIL